MVCELKSTLHLTKKKLRLNIVVIWNGITELSKNLLTRAMKWLEKIFIEENLKV